MAVLSAVATFVALQVAFHFPLSHFWPALSDVEYGPKLTRLRAQVRSRSTNQPLVVAFGSSLTGMGLRPGDAVPPTSDDTNRPLVFNCAMKSGSIIVQLVCFRRLLAEGIRPDLVLVETYPPFFLSNTWADPRNNEPLPSHRLLWNDLPLVTRYYGAAHRVRNEWREGQCFPWHYHRNVLMNWHLPNWVPKEKRTDADLWHTDEWGWDCCPSFYEAMKQSYRTSQYRQTLRAMVEGWSKCELSEDLHSALLELLSLCRSTKIDAVMVWPPEATLVRASHSSAMNDRCERWFARLRVETGVPLINARDWVSDDNFADGLHLNPDGALDYSVKLVRDVRARLDAGGQRLTARRR